MTTTAARILIAAYVAVGAVNVVAEAAAAEALAAASKIALMPLLGAWLVATAGRSTVATPLRWLAVGLPFAWLGDLLLIGDSQATFIAGVGAFLVMQALYLAAFTRVPGPGLVRAWPIALVPYLAAWVLLNALVWGGVGDLRIPVLVYSTVLVAMAVAALDLVIRVPRSLGWQIAIGAALFVVSDALIALGAFEVTGELPAVVMATYIAAQGLIVTAFTRTARSIDGTAAVRR